METIIASIITCITTLTIAYIHKRRHFKRRDVMIDELQTKLSITDSNVIIISSEEDIPRRLLKTKGSFESNEDFQITKILIIK
tara:strand:+ start:896 stop:1144 length:249 start_codon:yes stop_codon:yes gene_type:complete